MKNKIFIRLSLFLLFPLTTHCMEKNHTELIPFQPKTMQELQTKHDKFKEELDNQQQFAWRFGLTSSRSILFLSCTYRQDLHKKTYPEYDPNNKELKEEFGLLKVSNVKMFNHFNIDRLKDLSEKRLEMLKKIRIDNYSALGSATMAGNVSFQEKQEFIQKLLDLGFEPTPGDRELALVERWERIKSIRSIYIQKICLLIYASNNSQVPRDLVQYILSLKFDTELLF